MTSGDREQIGHYVLGLLDKADMQAFERRLGQEPALRAAVERLQSQMGALDDTVSPLPVDAALWDRLAAQLDSPALPSARPRPASNDNAKWRWAAVAASLVVALGIGYGAGRMGVEEQQPLMVAVLLNETDAAPGAIIHAFADDHIRVIALEAFPVPQGQVLEVWTLPNRETGPVSLGQLDAAGTIDLAGPSLPPPQPGQLYEITLEPAPRSPTGRPTGPILVKGFAKSTI